MDRLPTAPTTDSHMRRRKIADVMSGLGALILGVGLGAMFAAWLGGSALLLAVVGGVLHAVGMWEKHRLEIEPSARRPWWVTGLYWLCWLLLVPSRGSAVARSRGADRWHRFLPVLSVRARRLDRVAGGNRASLPGA